MIMVTATLKRVTPTVGYPPVEPGRVSQDLKVELPDDVLREAGIRRGDLLQVTADGDGRLVLEKIEDPLEKLAGSVPGLERAVNLQALRDEWER
jgi:bifunctional DNA-binding transcriptional regulator/antitoxin component of YhaV-PrlF toxin-antitoxin module